MKIIVPILLALLFTAISSTSVLSQELTLFPGFWSYEYYEDDNRITKTEFKNLIRTDESAQYYMDKADNSQYLLIGSFFAYIGSSIWIGASEASGGSIVASLLSVGGIIGGSIGLTNNRKKAVLQYNKGFDKNMGYGELGRMEETPSLSLGSTRHGLGLILTF